MEMYMNMMLYCFCCNTVHNFITLTSISNYIYNMILQRPVIQQTTIFIEFVFSCVQQHQETLSLTPFRTYKCGVSAIEQQKTNVLAYSLSM